ncbi:MAG: hypothetical protein VR70_10765 [Rhodospirillaceae bacterium BRH_c57]|nr:MAG: hypothetical protein VR70_10765 [Rhodospirillaceae bacterium BRH_c57]
MGWDRIGGDGRKKGGRQDDEVDTLAGSRVFGRERSRESLIHVGRRVEMDVPSPALVKERDSIGLERDLDEMMALSPTVAREMGRGLELLREHDATRTHEGVKPETAKHYGEIFARMLGGAKGEAPLAGRQAIQRPEAVSRTQRTYYSRRAAMIYCASEGVADALKMMAAIAWRNGIKGMPEDVRTEVAPITAADPAECTFSLTTLPAEERRAWTTAHGDLQFYSAILEEWEPGRKEDVHASVADGRKRLWREDELDIEPSPHDRDSRRKQADLFRQDPRWKESVWPHVEAWASVYRDALAVSFALGPRPAELKKGVYVTVAPDGSMQVSVAAVKNDNGHGSLRRTYRYKRGAGEWHPWLEFLHRRASEAGKEVMGMRSLRIAVRDEKAYSESVKDCGRRTGYWRLGMWKEAVRRKEPRMDALAVGLALPAPKRSEHLYYGVSLRLKEGELEVVSARGYRILTVEDARDAKGARVFCIKGKGGNADEWVAAKQTPWLAMMFDAARKGGVDSEGWRVTEVRLPSKAEARDLLSSLSKGKDGTEITGWSITPYVFRHQFMADCKQLSKAEAGEIDGGMMSEMTGNNSSWDKYGGRATGSAAGPGFVSVRRAASTLSPSRGRSRGMGLSR